jgi:hypothetical protein
MDLSNTVSTLSESVKKAAADLKSQVQAEHTKTGRLSSSIEAEGAVNNNNVVSDKIVVLSYVDDLEGGVFFNDWIKKSADNIAKDIAESIGQDIGNDIDVNI